MDPFDEFEFKPLTDGLGFHKKKPENNQKASALDDISQLSPSRTSIPDLVFENDTENLLPPLPRKTKAPIVTEDKSNSTVDEILKTLRENQRLDFDAKKAPAKATRPQETYKATTWNVSSSLLDAMLVVAASLLCMIILLSITKVDLIANLSQPDEGGMIYLSTLSLFLGVSFIYLVAHRVFLGATPGEWAFDQRIGKPEEMKDPMYTVRVTARSLLIVATGFILLPIISLFLGRDIAGSITGASLFRKA